MKRRPKHQMNVLNVGVGISVTCLAAAIFFGCGAVEFETEGSTLNCPTEMTSIAETITEIITETSTEDGSYYIQEYLDGTFQVMHKLDGSTNPSEEADRIIAQYTTSGYWHESTGEEYKDGILYASLYFVTPEEEVCEEYYDDGWYYIDCPYQVNSTYEGVHCITDETSYQWAWLQSHDYYFDSEGIATYDGRTLVALSPAFGSIGDYVDLLLADGSVLPVIIVDHKGDADTWGHNHDGAINVIEILVSYEWYEVNHENKWYADVVAFR